MDFDKDLLHEFEKSGVRRIQYSILPRKAGLWLSKLLRHHMWTLKTCCQHSAGDWLEPSSVEDLSPSREILQV